MQAKILIVDDSKTIRFQVRRSFDEDSDYQFDIVECEDGEKALKWLCGRSVEELPDVILLDRNMPRLSGDECIRLLKADTHWSNIPVLFLTTHKESSEVVKGLSELRADDYLAKPFDPQEMMARVKVLLRMKHAEDQTRAMNQALQQSLQKQEQAYEELKITKIELAETTAAAKMTKVFEKFVPKQFLARIAKEGIDKIQLGHVESDNIAILFSDIRAFTTLSEIMTPQEVFKFLNSYLSRMHEQIEHHGGFIDKYIGDAIMALFDLETDELEVDKAMSAAIDMQEQVKIYNQHRKNYGYRPIKIGVGIHTGNVMIGTLGSKDRMDSTVIGDAVNIASRLENLTKYYKCQIITSARVLELLKNDAVLYRLLDFVYMKGKDHPVIIYEVFNTESDESQEKKLKNLALYHEGVSAYQERRWDDSMKLFQQCLKLHPEDYVSQLYLERCSRYRENPPNASWNGAFKFEHK